MVCLSLINDVNPGQGLHGLQLQYDNGAANSRVSHDGFHFYMHACLTL